jgi:hypothetical protein
MWFFVYYLGFSLPHLCIPTNSIQYWVCPVQIYRTCHLRERVPSVGWRFTVISEHLMFYRVQQIWRHLLYWKDLGASFFVHQYMGHPTVFVTQILYVYFHRYYIYPYISTETFVRYLYKVLSKSYLSFNLNLFIICRLTPHVSWSMLL